MPSRPSEALPDGSAPPDTSAESAVESGAVDSDTESFGAAEAAPAESAAAEAVSGAAPTSDPALTQGSPAGTETTEEQPSAAVVAQPTAEHARRVRVLTAFGVAAVLLLAAAGVALVGWVSTLNSGPAANDAYVDSAATAEVVGQVTEAVTTVYSYDYNALPANEAAARTVITGPFAEEFGRVFEPVKQLAPAQQAVLRTTVPAAGVKLLDGDRAQLLMMVDQNGVRGPAKEPTGATARLVVDAQKVDGRWKISEVTPE